MKRRYLFWAFILTLIALILTQVPLFNLLGFEFSLAMSIVIAMAAGHLTVGLVHYFRAKLQNVDNVDNVDNVGNLFTVGNIGNLFFISLLANFSLLIPPLIILLLNAFRVKNCDIAQGFAFFGLMPVITCIYATSAGLFFGLLAKTARRGYWLFISYLLLTVAFGIYHLIFHPPKFLYNAIIGYFPGPIYDEEVRITAALIVSRFRTLITASIFLLLSIMLYDNVGVTPASPLRRFYGRQLTLGDFAMRFLLFALVSSIYIIYLYRGDLGISISRSYLQNKLGGKYTTEHFDIYYDRSSQAAEEIRFIAQDHEFRYYQLARFFKLQPKRRIGSYVYASADQKKRLMGAKGTSMEDPINSEMHLNYQPFPHNVLKHELAHVFCGNFHPILKVSPKIGIHEGIAVAADWEEGELTPHQLSKAMIELKIAPSLKKILGAFGFWTQPSAKSYTLSGSFIRYLVDTYGIEKFKGVFPTGNFKKHYHKSLDELIAEWKKFLDGIKVSLAEIKAVEGRLRAPSIFQKTCAHEIAELENKAWLSYRNGDYSSAISDFQRIYHLNPDDPKGLRGLMYSYYAEKNYDQAISIANQILSHGKVGARAGQALPLHALLKIEAKNFIGNSLWQKGKIKEAETLFSEIYQLHLSSAYDREMSIKLASMRSPEILPLMRDVLASDESELVKMLKLKETVEIKPDFAAGFYMIGRQLHFAKSHDDSIKYLQKSEALGLSDQSLAIESWKLLGINKFMIGRYEEAIGYFNKIVSNALHEGQVSEAKDWLERCQLLMTDVIAL